MFIARICSAIGSRWYELGVADDVAQRGLCRPAHGGLVVLDLDDRLLRVGDDPEEHGVDVHRDGVLGQCLLGGERRGADAHVDGRDQSIEAGEGPVDARVEHALKASEAEQDASLPLLQHAR
jgi:hypothetical protein